MNASHEGIDWLFIRIPKTASTSISRVTRPLPHHTTAEWIEILGEEEFNRRFKFSFTRNPYDRFLSMYYFFGLFDRNINPNNFLKDLSWTEFSKKTDFPLIKPQTDYLLHPIDFIGRFENPEEDWEKVAKQINASQILPHLRKCRFNKAILNQYSKDVLYNYYKEDFDQLGYIK